MKTIIIEKSRNENGGIILEGHYDDNGTIISWGDTFEEAWMDFMIVYDSMEGDGDIPTDEDVTFEFVEEKIADCVSDKDINVF